MRTGGSVVLAVVMLVALRFVGATAAQPDSAGHSVDSPREALEVTFAYTNFKEINALIEAEDYSGVSVITLKDSTIPFLVNRVYNKPVWEIRLDSIYLDMPRCSAEREAMFNPKQFYILIDSTSGFFIKAFTRYKGDDTSVGHDARADMTERQLHDEEFVGFCFDLPPIKMHEGLGAAAGAQALSAKELTVYLVRQNYRGEQKLMWNVLGRGVAPWLSSIGPLPSINFARSVVNAETGDLMYITTTPDPER